MQDPDRDQNIMIPFSGPISVPMDRESPLIRAAPAYDTEAARTFIQSMPLLRTMTDNIPDDERPACFGPKCPSPAAFQKLETEIGKITEGRHKLSLLMADLKTLSGVSYHSRVPMCTQSTVKAIYAGALIESIPSVLDENGQYLHDAVVYSDNASYENLRKIYGCRPLEKWCEEAGVDRSFAIPDYPRDKTAADMFRMWTRLYCFLNDGSDRTNFGAYFADSLASATKERLGSRYPVQTKAGWEIGLDENGDYDPGAEIPAEFTDGDPSNDECAINDTGVVYTESGPYLFVIYSDHPFGIFRNYTTPNPLYGLVDALAEVRESLAGADPSGAISE